MARTVNKSVKSATIYALDANKAFECDENGMPIANVIIPADGAPNANKARLIAEKTVGHKNVMVLNVEIDAQKLTVSPIDFWNASQDCIDGETYGREYITQTFKVTAYSGFAMYPGLGMVPISGLYMGHTTQNKLLIYAKESAILTTDDGKKQTPLSVVLPPANVMELERRRYMTRELYMTLAK